MQRERAQFAVVSEFEGICDELVRQHPEAYAHVDPSVLRMTMILNREPPTDGSLYEIVHVSAPFAQFCSVQYVIVTWRELWEELDLLGKTSNIAKVLDHIR